MRKLSMQRVAVLVDGENIEKEARKKFGKKINFESLVSAVNGRELIRLLYFTPLDTSPEFQAMLENGHGIEFKRTPKNADMWLFKAAVSLISKVDVISLFAGDLDYLPMVQLLQSHGVKVEVWSFRSCTSSELIAQADEYRSLDARILL